MITKEMTIQDIVARYPESIPVFERYGLSCIGCLGAEFESLEAGTSFHGIRLEEILRDLNSVRRGKAISD